VYDTGSGVRRGPARRPPPSAAFVDSLHAAHAWASFVGGFEASITPTALAAVIATGSSVVAPAASVASVASVAAGASPAAVASAGSVVTSAATAAATIASVPAWSFRPAFGRATVVGTPAACRSPGRCCG
jgi:hypothetical protein